MIEKTLRRHLLPITLTSVLLMCVWLVVGTPILFAFILDDAFKVSELFMFMLYTIGIGLAISLLVAVPLTWIFEKVFSESKIIIVLIAGALLLVSLLISFGFLFDSQLMHGSYPWGGNLLIFLFTVASYFLIFVLSNIQKSQSKA